MAVMLYLLGLSYEAVEIVSNSLGIGIGTTSVYWAVQAIAEQAPGLKRELLRSCHRPPDHFGRQSSIAWLAFG